MHRRTASRTMSCGAARPAAFSIPERMPTMTAAAEPQRTETNAEELTAWRDTIRRFLADEVEPHYDAWEKAGMIPKALYLKLGAAGFLCVDAPEEYDGAGAPLEFSFAIADESARPGYLRSEERRVGEE